MAGADLLLNNFNGRPRLAVARTGEGPPSFVRCSLPSGLRSYCQNDLRLTTGLTLFLDFMVATDDGRSREFFSVVLLLLSPASHPSPIVRGAVFVLFTFFPALQITFLYSSTNVKYFVVIMPSIRRLSDCQIRR